MGTSAADVFGARFLGLETEGKSDEGSEGKEAGKFKGTRNTTLPVKSTTNLAVVVVGRRVSFFCWVPSSGVLDKISSREFPSRKARYCSLVSFGGMDTGKSNIQGERERKREEREEREKMAGGKKMEKIMN